MKLADTDIIIVPGLGNSEPGHWQRRWDAKFNQSMVVEQAEWDNPALEPWVQTIEKAVMMATRPVVLVGHSLGSLAIVHAAMRMTDTKVRGAFLVAPPDPDNGATPVAVAPFGPVPTGPLPFPSMLVASNDDPYCTIERSAEFAIAWASDFHAAGPSGHLNVESGHGPWPEGLLMFTRLMQRLRV